MVRREALRPEGHATALPDGETDLIIIRALAWPALPAFDEAQAEQHRLTTAPVEPPSR